MKNRQSTKFFFWLCEAYAFFNTRSTKCFLQQLTPANENNRFFKEIKFLLDLESFDEIRDEIAFIEPQQWVSITRLYVDYKVQFFF